MSKRKKKLPMYFIGRMVMRRQSDTKMKVTFYSNHDYPFHKASIWVENRKEALPHFEAFKEDCERYRQNPSNYTGLALKRGTESAPPALK